MENLPTCKPVSQYLTELKKHLETAREFAEQHAQKAQEQYAKYYNAQHVALPQDIAKTLASSIVSSRLDYCNAVLYGTPNLTTSKLHKVQNCLARVMLQRRKFCHAQPLLKSLHWLPISQRINFKLATLAFKIQSTSQPEYLHQLISSQHPSSSMTLRSSTRPLLQAPHTRTAYGSRAFSSAVPAIWNNLPTLVIEANSLPAFRRRLKTHLFIVAFENSG